MGTKFRFSIIILLVVMGLVSGVAAGQAQESTDSSVIGPYTEIQLPIEDLPPLNVDLVYRPEIRLSPYQDDDDVLIQILYVLDDPREVPLARFAYNGNDGVIGPVNDIGSLANYDLKTINVYVQTKTIGYNQIPDPLLAPDPAGYDENWPAFNLYVENPTDELGGTTRFPCAKMEYADGSTPYQLPAGIEGGDALGKDGLYDPAAYAPPKPWYYSENPMLEPGEVREGWVSCLAPDVPLEQLEINARLSYIKEPEIVLAKEDILLGLDIYVPDTSETDISELEIIGLTPADLPADLEECDQLEYCVSQNLISLDHCKWAAKEAGLEKGLCSFYSLINSDGEYEDLTSRVFYTFVHEEPTHNSYPVWSFAGAGLFPANALRLEDVPLSFSHDEHGVKTVRGSAVYYDPRIDQSDHYAGTISGWETKYTFISRVKVEPYGMEEEDLEGYRLIEIGTKVSALIEEEGTIHGAGVNKIYQFTLYAQPDNIFELTVSADLESSIADEAFLPQSIGLLRPGTALINLYQNYDNDVVSFNSVEIYPAKVINIHSPNLVSKTNMCDVVDCVEYWDEDDTSHDVIKPRRSIPVMCAGEWANNIIVDDLQVIKFMEYIREPWGDGRDRGTLRHNDINYGRAAPVFLYDLRIMGGATPWWIKTTPWSNSKSFGPLDHIYGHTVDLETGWPTHTDAAVIPYYAVIENDLSKGYLARGASYPVNIYSEKSGWMGEIIDQKVLAFSSVNVFEDGEDYMRLNGENTGFLLLEEGPLWVTDCQRDLMPALSSQVLYAPDEVNLASVTDGSRHAMNSLLPGMIYPPYLSVVDGKIYSVGEYGDTYTYEKSSAISHFKFTVKDAGIIRGKPDRSVVYVPTEDKFYPAEKYPNWNNRLFFAKNNAFVIPPDTTYVEIVVGVDRLEISEGSYCGIDDEDLQLVYPGYLPINGIIETKPGVPTICKEDDSSFKILFLFPSLDFKLEKMLFSIRGGPQEPWNFWRLIDN